MTSGSVAPPPTEIKLNKARNLLTVSFLDGKSYKFTAEFLRVLSPSAEVQGHHPDQRVVLGGKRLVTIVSVEPVGNYAVKLLFDDGHRTGIYSWSYFHEVGANQKALWEDYLKELNDRNLSR